MAGKHASVHPCRHGAVMKKIIDVLMSRGVNPEVDKYVSNLPLPPLPFPSLNRYLGVEHVDLGYDATATLLVLVGMESICDGLHLRRSFFVVQFCDKSLIVCVGLLVPL